MKIAFVLTQSLDSPSGLGRYGPIAREMVKLGYEVEIIALHHAWDKLEKKVFIDSGVLVNYVGQMHVRKQGDHKLYYSPLKFLWISVIATLRLTWALFCSNAAVIHLGKPQPFNVIAGIIGKRNRPLYCDCDDYEAYTNNFSNKWQFQVVKFFENHIIYVATKITVNTLFTYQRFIDLGYNAEKIFYVPNGVERSRFDHWSILDVKKLRKKWGINSGEPLIVFVGTLGLLSHPVDLLLKSFPLVLQRYPGSKLMIVGGGEDISLLNQHASELGIDKNTIFTGRIDPDQIPLYFAMATVTVDPVFDNYVAKARYPLKIVESLAVGTPVVSSNVGDRVDLINNEEKGILVSPGDCIALADGLLKIIDASIVKKPKEKFKLSHQENLFWDNLIYKFLLAYQ